MEPDDSTEQERKRNQRLLFARLDNWWGDQMEAEFERCRQEEIQQQEDVDARRKERE